MKKFSTSVLAKEELAKHTKLCIIKDVPTRWWSKLDQIKRIGEIYKQDRQAFRKVCLAREWKTSLDLDDDDLIMLQYFLDFFESFRQKSDVLGGEKSSNIHLVFIYTKDLQQHIETFFEHEKLGKFSRRFHLLFMKQFEFILNPDHPEFECVFLATSLLSPLYLNFLSAEEQNEGFRFLREELKRIEGPVRPKIIVQRKNVEFPGIKLQASNNLVTQGDHLEKTLNKDKDTLLLEAASKLLEVQTATEENKLFLMNEDPIEYWNQNKKKYSSRLPIVARNLLAVSPSSVPSERLFSIASLLSSGISIFLNLQHSNIYNLFLKAEEIK